MQIEKYIADKITSLCEKRNISKYRLSQLSGISQSSLGRIMAQENLPSLITLEKICIALGVTLSQFFQESNSENLTEEQKKNTISALSLETNEKVLDYWIALGRLQTEEAENIAQQVSDNDLLLYAYLKEKNMLETDTEISGKDKSDKLADLEGKIEQLTEEK